MPEPSAAIDPVPASAAARPPGGGAIIPELHARFGPSSILAEQAVSDAVPTLWVSGEQIVDVISFLKRETDRPYTMLYDVTAIDERNRRHRDGLPESLFTLVYTLTSFGRNSDIRLKVPLTGGGAAGGAEEPAHVPSVSGVFPAADWYEREVWDMFGVVFDGHPNLRRILMPPWWNGHPLRKDHPARATEMGTFRLPEDDQEEDQRLLQFHPEEWNMVRKHRDTDFMFLNVGPQHPGTHGVLRIVLQLDGEEIVDAVPDIGYHHRGAEKMGERQTWHTYIPYTDRIDYLAGVINNFAYCQAVEQLAGIDVPDRAKVIRVMMAELFRISNHLVWYGTFAQDVGALSPVFYTFNDRERLMQIIEAVTGARMHPGWFRIGGVAADLPDGWEGMVRDFLAYLPGRLRDYDRLVMRNRIFKGRTVGVGAFSTEEAIEWGVTGPNLRATGFAWDLRKKRPYSGYDQFEFDIPTASGRGDAYDRAAVRVEEMRQSLRIIEQCVNRMPPGDYKSRHPLTTPPVKNRTMHDIETLIHHFLNETWGPVIPPGEGMFQIEAAKGNNGYYLVSDGGTQSYRTRIRTPSFPHMQILSWLSRGGTVADLLSILGSLDYVLADVDR